MSATRREALKLEVLIRGHRASVIRQIRIFALNNGRLWDLGDITNRDGERFRQGGSSGV